MTDKCYKSYKFSVKQVHLMGQLIETGITESEVLAGFKQIQDMNNKSPSQSSKFFSSVKTNSNNAMLFSTPSYNKFSASPSSTASTPGRRSQRTSVLNSIKLTEKKFDNSWSKSGRRGRKRRGSPLLAIAGRRGKPGTLHSNFEVTDEDRNLYCTEVIDLMTRSVSEVAREISIFMKKYSYKIRQIVDANHGNLYYAYCTNWFKRPHTSQKRRICGIYQWYVAALKKINESLIAGRDIIETNDNIDDSLPNLNLETEAYLDGLFKSFISNNNFEPQDFDAVGIAAKAAEMMGGATITPAQISNVFFARFYSDRENCQVTEVIVSESSAKKCELRISESSKNNNHPQKSDVVAAIDMSTTE